MSDIPAIHPGEVLSEDFMTPNNVSSAELALAIGVPEKHISDIVRCERAIDDATARGLGHYFGTSPEFWMNLQAARPR